jgi:catechol 2,3-dioxygenase
MSAARLPDATSIGAVHLIVRDLDRSVGFYERTIGFERTGSEPGIESLGAGGSTLVVLHGEPEAPPRPPRTAGLFHFAILVPSRLELGRAVARLAASGWRLTGASDHLVSEAVYLNDPDGIGIEIYRDRPREEWEYDGDAVRMATLPLHLDSILAELDGPEDATETVAAGTRIGHVHLNVADIGDSERFYCDDIGFEVTVRGYPGALFVSAGGYHHHLGLNTWNGEGVPPPPPGAIGLERYEVLVPGGETRDAVDPSGLRVSLVAS